MGTDTKRGGCHPATVTAISRTGRTSAYKSNDLSVIEETISERGRGDSPNQYSIVRANTPQPHDPLEAALVRLEAAGYSAEAYQDVINMAIAQTVLAQMMTEEEGRRLFEGRQQWQEMKVV